MEPPFSIPNKEVKRVSADDSVGATLRENTSGPGYWFERESPDLIGAFFVGIDCSFFAIYLVNFLLAQEIDERRAPL